MDKKQFELFLRQCLVSKGDSLNKAKKFFKEPDEIKLKKKLLSLLKNI